ncbi:MAG: tetratricopeptide repeat protein [Elusimicrobiota bacterium]
MKFRGFRRSRAAVFLTSCAVLASGCAAPPPRREAPATMERVYALLRENRPEDAADALSRILHEDPLNGQARSELAYLDIRLKRWQDAVSLLDAAIDADPANLRLRMERGYARQALGDFAAAADEFTAVSREPSEFQEQARASLKELDGQSTDAARALREDALLNAGYDDLRRGRNAEAREQFKMALTSDPGRTEVAKQLGYMSLADGDLAAAAAGFSGVHRLDPEDYETALQLGYIYDALHNEAAAAKSFAAALASPDPKIHDDAAAALANVRAAQQRVYLDVYGAPYYTSRFSNKLAYFEAALGYKPAPDWPLSFFIGSRYAQDTRSHSGVAPQIYGDNVLSAGPGIRFQPMGWNANLTIEEDVSWNLIQSSSHPRATEADGRAVLADYHYWDGPVRTFADAGASVGYYSRYENNGIALIQLRAGGKLWNSPVSRVLLYAPVNVVKDVNRDYYNNLGEFGAGVEYQPLTKVDFKLRVEYLRGVYMGISGVEKNPYGRDYNDLRVLLVFSGRFVARKEPDGFQPTRRPEFRW